MPKRQPTVDPSDVRHPSRALELAMEGQRSSPSREQLVTIHNRYWGLRQIMDALMNRTDGWMRVIPHPDNHQVYLKWKYTSGPHQRYYVMAVVRTEQLEQGIALLAHKLAQVELGVLRPSPDTLYSEEEPMT